MKPKRPKRSEVILERAASPVVFQGPQPIAISSTDFNVIYYVDDTLDDSDEDVILVESQDPLLTSLEAPPLKRGPDLLIQYWSLIAPTVPGLNLLTPVGGSGYKNNGPGDVCRARK